MDIQANSTIAPDEAASVVSDALLQAAGDLKLTNEELGEIIGVSPAFISQLRRGKRQLARGKKPYQLAQLLVRVYRALYPLAGGDIHSMRDWLRTQNLDLDHAEPMTLMRGPEGLVGVVDYLDGYRARV